MSRLYHECPMAELLLKGVCRDINISTDESGRVWGMGVEEYGFPILFCPFCGAAIEKESQVLLCGEAGPAQKACDREQGHDGPHRAGWTGTVAIPGFKKEEPAPSPGAQWIKWEYKVVFLRIEDPRSPLRVMNDLGEEGWEVFQYDPNHDRIFVRRPKPAPVAESSSDGKVTP